MNYTEVNKDHLNMIISNLMTAYAKDDILEMLKPANFLMIDNGYKVTYDCGTEDKFFFVHKLVHESEI